MPINETLFYVIAAVLGLLAFFEPCTIATHTLFAARVHQMMAARPAALMHFFIARSALLAGLFAGASLINLPAISPRLASTLLLAASLLYAVTRSVYLPLPHLELSRIIPGGKQWPQGLQLGLTLPACTLPLLVLLLMLTAKVHQPVPATLAGLLFASLFSAPTIWQSWHGMSPMHRIWLGRIATAAPYFTAMLLCSAALYLWIA